MDPKDELNALAGNAGADVLKGAEAAIDDLEQAGIVAKDAALDDTSEEEPITDVAETEAEPVVQKAARPDLAAMKEAIDRLAQDQKEVDGVPVDAEMVQLRETVATLRQEVDELKARAEVQQVQVKSFDSMKDLPVRFNELQQEHEKALEVLTGLYDVVMGFHTGTKEVVIEKNGSGSAHDPDGQRLQQQVEQMLGGTQPKQAGQYAAAQIFG